MDIFLFYFLSALTVFSAVMVTLSRNTVNGAMYMVLSLIGTAGLFAVLGAYFLAALQVLVYAGAVMVLFIFIIMLVDVDAEEKVKIGTGSLIAALIATITMSVGVFMLFYNPEWNQPLSVIAESSSIEAFGGSAKKYGALLYSKNILPIQVVGMLLLIAMVGVILISKNLFTSSTPEEVSEQGEPTES